MYFENLIRSSGELTTVCENYQKGVRRTAYKNYRDRRTNMEL